MSDYEVSKVLALSTAHIPKSCDEALMELLGEDSGRELVECVWVDRVEYGYLITIGNYSGSIEEPRGDSNLSGRNARAIREIVELAEGLGCSLVRIDGDGPVVDELRKFDW